jgi:L-lactate dehydrogenase complex protein LldE
LKVQLFITCLTEQFFPSVLENMVKILNKLDISIEFPAEQTCCGQPFFNSGFQEEARKMAIRWLQVFSESDADIVSPSGSCVDMVRQHYPHLFKEGSHEYLQAIDLANRTYEFSEYLVNKVQVVDLGAVFPHRVTYHASCHLLRGLGIKNEPKSLLQKVKGLEFVPLGEEDTCCGFGGIFSVVFPEVSQTMMDRKIKNIQSTGADIVTACDAGCLMNIGGGLKKADLNIKAMHLIDILASEEN